MLDARVGLNVWHKFNFFTEQRQNMRGRGGGRGRYNSPRYNSNNNNRWNRQDRDYNNRSDRRDNNNRWSRQEQPEPLIEMESSKMMTSKEKEWIFKISMMSLLSGDFMTSDYYFIVSFSFFLCFGSLVFCVIYAFCLFFSSLKVIGLGLKI